MAAAVRRVVVVGSGSSSGTPQLRCTMGVPSTDPVSPQPAGGRPSGPCPQCRAAAADRGAPDHRTPPCLLLEMEMGPAAAAADCAGGRRFALVDCGKALREAALKVLAPAGVSRLDALLLTHDHVDACGGLDDLREFATPLPATPVPGPLAGAPLPVLCDAATAASCRRRFEYLAGAMPVPAPTLGVEAPEAAAVGPGPGVRGGLWVANLRWLLLDPAARRPFLLLGVPVTPFYVEHGPGYRCCAFAVPLPVGRLAYISDASAIPEDVFAFLAAGGPPAILVLDMLSRTTHRTHFGVADALAAARRIGAGRTFFVGMSHSLSHSALEAEVQAASPTFRVAVDGLTIFDAAGDGAP